MNRTTENKTFPLSKEAKMIVDVHVHLGWDFTFDEEFTKSELVEKMEHYEVDVQIVQPATCHDLDTVVGQHNAIHDLTREFPGHFYGMANPSPHLPADVYHTEIKRCIEELGFKAIKIHPMASGVAPGSKSGRKAFDAAREFNVPIMVHTGGGSAFRRSGQSDRPGQIIPGGHHCHGSLRPDHLCQ